ncbi:MAG: CBS domain-containing protein [Thermodesulfobacteriota bacterium]
MSNKPKEFTAKMDELIADEDIYAAMREIPGYLDISPADFKELYHHAYRHAKARLYSSLKAADIMTREVIVARPSASLAEVAGLLASNHVSGLPVVEENGEVVGIISERDFFKSLGNDKHASVMAFIAASLVGGGCGALAGQGLIAEQIMTKPVVSVAETSILPEISTLMRSRKINRVVVLDNARRLVGIVSRNDLMAAFLQREMP